MFSACRITWPPPSGLIGTSNSFGLAVAAAIALFGPGSAAALATVVGVFVGVPAVLPVCTIGNRTRQIASRRTTWMTEET